jgi:hypothetical protein
MDLSGSGLGKSQLEIGLLLLRWSSLMELTGR